MTYLLRLILIVIAALFISANISAPAYACGDPGGANICTTKYTAGLVQIRDLTSKLADAQLTCHVAQQGVVCNWLKYYGFSIAQVEACQVKKHKEAKDDAKSECGRINEAIRAEQDSINKSLVRDALAEPALAAKATAALQKEADLAVADVAVKAALITKEEVVKTEVEDYYSNSCSIIYDAVDACKNIDPIIQKINDVKQMLINDYVKCLSGLKFKDAREANKFKAAAAIVPIKFLPETAVTYDTTAEKMMSYILSYVADDDRSSDHNNGWDKDRDVGDRNGTLTGGVVGDLFAGIAVCNTNIINQIKLDICIDCDKFLKQFMDALAIRIVPGDGETKKAAEEVAVAREVTAAKEMATAAGAAAAIAAPAEKVAVVQTIDPLTEKAAMYTLAGVKEAEKCCKGSDILDAVRGVCQSVTEKIRYAPSADYCVVAPTCDFAAIQKALDILKPCATAAALAVTLRDQTCGAPAPTCKYSAEFDKVIAEKNCPKASSLLRTIDAECQDIYMAAKAKYLAVCQPADCTPFNTCLTNNKCTALDAANCSSCIAKCQETTGATSCAKPVCSGSAQK